MSITLTGTFETRREAEMTVERLMQEFGIERTDIFIAAAGNENSAGEQPDGADTASADPTPEHRDDAALHGGIVVSVDAEDDALAEKIRAAFAEFGAQQVEAG